MIPIIQNSLVSGELSPSFLGRTDKPQYRNGASTLRNAFVRYTGGAYSRAGFAYVGMCKQGAPNAGGAGSLDNPPKFISFQSSINRGFALEFGEKYLRILFDGAYVVESGTTISAATNTNPIIITDTAHGYSNGDWVYITGMIGMTNLNGLTWVVVNASANTYQLTDLFGNPVDSANFSGYISGGTAARIYTVVSPYAAVDLPYLKFTQTANLMNLTCWNQITNTEYAPYTLQRLGQASWVFTQVSFSAVVAAPTGVSSVANASTTKVAWYSYVVTKTDLLGNESVASSNTDVYNNDISINAGSNIITWSSAGTNISEYNVFSATPIYVGAATSNPGFSGVPYGLIGSATGTKFIDTNIIPDFSITPPLHKNPFSGAGNDPGTVQYFQQRLVYANTINHPDTYYMSQPGLYTNFDSSIPTVDSDAITGTPWGVQINGIQFMIPTISGLLAFTGNGVWLINGGNSVAITPSDQNAQAQAQIGCSDTVPPLFINLHVLYVQSKDSIVRDIAFNFLYNTFTGTDITVYSNHLFLGYTILGWAYCEEPNKIVWAVRDDGTMLSLTYIKEQEIEGWARHDTNGLFFSVCSVVELPVDSLYAVTKRYIEGEGVWVYYSERANNRIWSNIEDCFCVDAGLSYPMTFPSATLTPAAADGTNNISDTLIITGGSGYTNPTATATDSSGKGTGATFSVTKSGGVITAITPITEGQDYTAGLTSITISDSTGSGASVQPIITNNVNFTTSSAVFSQIQYVYVTNSADNTVSVIDPVSNEVIKTITVGTTPRGLAVTPDGSQVWVCNTATSGTGSISVISTSSLTVTATFTVGTSIPIAVAFTPDGITGYVVAFLGKVYPVTVSTLTVGTGITCGLHPFDICILQNGATAYVVNRDDDTVTPITIASNTAGAAISVGSSPQAIAATPNSQFVYVTNINDSTVSIIATASNIVTDTITVGGSPSGIAIDPGGKSVYVAIAESGITIISAVSNLITQIITGSSLTTSDNMTVSADGRFLYAINFTQNLVTVISTQANTVTTFTAVGTTPSDVAVSSMSTASIGTIGDVIRVGGGKAIITEYISTTEVIANIIEPITALIPNDPNEMPIPSTSGNWSLSRPTTIVNGLNHLEGMTVTGLADGGVITPQTVTGGSITLQSSASSIVIGLPFRADLQTMPLEIPSQTTNQGKRKDIQAVTVRMEASRGVQVGTNQPNQSWQENNANIPWTNMKEVKERNNLITAGSAIPLFTGDTRILVPGDWDEKGLVAISQIYPLPLNVLAIIPEVTVGDASA